MQAGLAPTLSPGLSAERLYRLPLVLPQPRCRGLDSLWPLGAPSLGPEVLAASVAATLISRARFHHQRRSSSSKGSSARGLRGASLARRGLHSKTPEAQAVLEKAREEKERGPSEDDSEEEEEEEDDDDSGDVQVRPKMEIQKMLPEDKLSRHWIENPRPPRQLGVRSIRPVGKNRAKWDREEHEYKHWRHNPWGAFGEASSDDKEAVAKSWTQEAREKARSRTIEAREKHVTGDDVGTGEASPNAFIEIRERWDGPDEEAANIVIAQELGISPKKAARLVELGAAWQYDEFEEKDWVRIMGQQKIAADTVLRVFPNPERFPTCYVEDWEDRIKKIDRDFIVVDKPPLLPCFSQVSNGKETLSRCLAEALRVRTWGLVEHGIDDTDLMVCNVIDDEVSGLCVLARHQKAFDVFDEWLLHKEAVFEFVAICQKDVALGTYRHFYHKKQKKPGQPKPTLYEEIPPHMIQSGADYQEWELVEMEVVATAPLQGGCAAVRVRTKGDRKSTRLNSSHTILSRMPSSA
eukprot:TRINITY_DN6123_c0_g1_i1.p1 TRINITY_DN6123_c0_g1~~TRINITY_DN6123_c0_g1_i1.p1  ORF type:complete len:522 (+),score=109.86 TRINITY_DN6123_c0_g1_i1:24-1589(+)